MQKTIGYNDEMFKFQIILRGHGLYYQSPILVLGSLKEIYLMILSKGKQIMNWVLVTCRQHKGLI